MIYDLFSWLFDCVLTLWFFRALVKGQEKAAFRRWALLSLLLLTLPHYIMSYDPGSVIPRYLFRWLPVAFFLRLAFSLPPALCLYFSTLFTSALSAIQATQPLTELLIPDIPVLFRLTRILIKWTGLTVVSHFIPFDRVTTLRPIQIGVTAIETLLILYSKRTTGMVIQGSLDPSSEILLFPAVVLLLSLLLLATFDRFMVLVDEQRKQALLDLSRDYQYENLQAQLLAQEDVRRIYHDMKNHLLTLERMSTDQQKCYIQGILSETDSYGTLFRTGNATLDGLLHAKLLDAKSKGVHLSVNVDLSAINYLEPIDVCAIFGNVIDNAIEASEKLSDPADRFVELKSGPFADQLAIRVINSYAEGSVHLKDNQTMETTKKDKSRHGIGLASVRRSVEKYGGVLSLHTTPDHRLLLTILLPFPQTDAKSLSANKDI